MKIKTLTPIEFPRKFTAAVQKPLQVSSFRSLTCQRIVVPKIALARQISGDSPLCNPHRRLSKLTIDSEYLQSPTVPLTGKRHSLLQSRSQPTLAKAPSTSNTHQEYGFSQPKLLHKPLINLLQSQSRDELCISGISFKRPQKLI